MQAEGSKHQINPGPESPDRGVEAPSRDAALLDKFLDHLEAQTGERSSFLKRPELAAMTVDEFTSSPPERLLQLVSTEDERPSVTSILRLRTLAYFVAYKEIATQTTSDEQHTYDAGEKTTNRLAKTQERIDNLTQTWLEHLLAETDTITELDKEKAKVLNEMLQRAQSDLDSRKTPYTNLQVLRGGKCNAQCKFCFIQQLESDDPSIEAYLNDIRKVSYSKERLFLAMLHARMAYDLKEILFTSYGDPMANAVADLPSEVRMAKELGYPQITLLTNGLNLSPTRIDTLCEAGLTNLTVSLHTKSPVTHREIVRPKKKRISYDDIVDNVKYALSKGITVRINVAYSQQVEEAEELIKWAREELGVQQLTLLEMIPGNQWCVENHRPLPQEISGYEKGHGFHWGLQVWKPKAGVQGPSVALCAFGGNDPTFREQEKNLMLVLAPEKPGSEGPFLKAGALYGCSGTQRSWQI